ncbi:MAG: glycosyl hydrolase family 18 protein [Ruminiclostridium sp.]|nr:glycosyl hydrolase family 18 protein [Ruminiclostridium sp.]
MIIHVVKRGESIYQISRLYGVSANTIITENELLNPDRITVGQTLVISEGTKRHIITAGQTLSTIAAYYGTNTRNILAVNPGITNPDLIYPGQVILIPPQGRILGTIEVNGYALPSTNITTLEKTFPYLTYLAIFSYNVNADGSLIAINDTPFIQAARNAGVAPVMVITNRGFNSDIASAMLYNTAAQDALIRNVIQVLRNKGYYGLDIDFEYVYPSDRIVFNNFLRKIASAVKGLGYSISSALAPKVSARQTGFQYGAHDYPVHGQIMDYTVIMTYEWGWLYGAPMAVAPLNEVRKVVDYATATIPRQKILMGIPNYGYDWTLPFVKGVPAEIMSNVGAVQRAVDMNANIQYDPVAQSPYFNYYDRNGQKHIVWFEDARSIEAKLLLVNEYGLRGISYWTVGTYFPQNWLVLKSMYRIKKISL